MRYSRKCTEHGPPDPILDEYEWVAIRVFIIYDVDVCLLHYERPSRSSFNRSILCLCSTSKMNLYPRMVRKSTRIIYHFFSFVRQYFSGPRTSLFSPRRRKRFPLYDSSS
ncbi:unnamed protein product [Amoebophrya sp. A25]|nr:unnamed protein product [Amoebophrya sp. A25]|eukprot:GSA25T00011805001.1